MGTVVSIHRVPSRDAPAVALERARFVADLGLDGDWRSRKDSDRQITLIEAEALDAVAAALGIPGVPPGASRRQVMVRGVALNDMVGRHLRVGPLLVRVEDLCHPCRNLEAKIGRGAQVAMADRGGVCGRVIEGGLLSPGDPVSIGD
jgi:MOSC domain-containing protein YiiM